VHRSTLLIMSTSLRNAFRRARDSRGYTLLEILVVLAIIGLIAGVTALALFKFIPEARVKTSRESARVIRNAASLYRMDHTETDCPTIAVLTDAQVLDDATKKTDAWDVPFLIECEEPTGTRRQARITVVSAGPDKKMGTLDDIRVPEPPPDPTH
jgi:general secretion pathway protein G